MRYYQATDPFSIELDGVPQAVAKGATLPETDPIVRHDLAHGAKLFRLLDTGEPEPAPRGRAQARAPRDSGS